VATASWKQRGGQGQASCDRKRPVVISVSRCPLRGAPPWEHEGAVVVGEHEPPRRRALAAAALALLLVGGRPCLLNR
jgi:hypothetical protein